MTRRAQAGAGGRDSGVRAFHRVLAGVTLLLLLSLLAIAGVATVTFTTDGTEFPGSDWLVGLGFAAAWVGMASIAGLALLLLAAGIGRLFVVPRRERDSL